MEKGRSICCICKTEYPSAQSNNPYPVKPTSYEWGDTDVRCCQTCNERYVRPSRAILAHLRDGEERVACHEWISAMSLNELIVELEIPTSEAVKHFRMRHLFRKN